MTSRMSNKAMQTAGRLRRPPLIAGVDMTFVVKAL